MRSILLALALLAGSSILSAEPPARPFPDDYRAQPCAAQNTCVSFSRNEFLTAAVRHRGITNIEPKWLSAHWDELHSALEPACAKAASCYAMPGATFTFCNDVVQDDMRMTCNRYPAGSSDYLQCKSFVEVFALGRDQHSGDWWREAQSCATKAGMQPRSYAPIVWTVPASFPLDYAGTITFYALDPETRIPVQALVTIDGQKVYSSAAPRGLPTTNYGFKWPLELVRVPNAAGHEDLVAPDVTIASEWFAPVRMKMPVVVPQMTVEMKPPASKLRRGKNTVTVSTRDAKTGKPVEARLMLGDRTIGDTNQPLTIELPKNGKHADLWVTSLFDHYGDVVVVPAKK